MKYRLLFASGIVVAAVAVAGIALAQRGGSTIATEKIFAAIGVREGATICEIGAGNGELSIAAAKIAGGGGRVYTSELGDERVQALQKAVKGSGLSTITVVPGADGKTNFPDGACDALFMRNVYHHFPDPAAMNAAIGAALKPGGRLAIVDFAPSTGKEADKPEDRDENATHGVSSDAVARELNAAGFEPVSAEQGTDRWFMVVVAKPKR